MDYLNYTDSIQIKYELKYVSDRFLILMQKLESKDLLSEEEFIECCNDKIKFLFEK